MAKLGTEIERMAAHERFRAWQLCHQLVVKTYDVTRAFPSDERYGLTSQARRAAFSAAANIAEGAAKQGPREFRRFLDVSLGSLGEMSYIFRLARDLAYIDDDALEGIENLRRHASIVTWKLYNSVR